MVAPMEKRNPADVIKLAEDSGAVILDLKFLDFPGTWQHFTVPIDSLTEESC
jgi:glutamine synthetase